ncbi:hypothetical protein Taro_024631 [Colocasia esculenta]|uniref:Glutaredoxin domain-containing protein n=1 Tax=Colocasia esculenta TaxID=4460 RepID=A0A843VBU6_COLES|nr:hypothetical protein [Colocasia esculenta]
MLCPRQNNPTKGEKSSPAEKRQERTDTAPPADRAKPSSLTLLAGLLVLLLSSDSQVPTHSLVLLPTAFSSPSAFSTSSYLFFSELVDRRGRMYYQAAAAESWGPYMQGAATCCDPLERVERLASESAVVIFSASSCCMCHAVKRLFCGMGVNPTVYELDEDPRGKDMERALMRLLGGTFAVPIVFIGGKLVGAMDRVMTSHINGTLVPLLKEAGALWL